MKIETTKEKLLDGLTKVERAAGKHLSLPILSNILLEAKDKSLYLRATNLDLGIEIEVPAKVSEDGMLAVSAQTLKAFISNLRDQKISMEVKDKNLLVSNKHTSAVLKTVPHDDFPSIPKVSAEYAFKIPTKRFIEGVKSVWYSASVSSIKPELSSVYIYPEENSIVFVATDSFRLAEKRVLVKKHIDFNPLLVPIKNIVEVVKIFSDHDGELEIRVSQNQVAFVVPEIYVTSRLIDGSFPDYKQVIPKEYQTTTVALKEDLLTSLKATNVFSDKFNQIKFSVVPNQKTLSIQTQNADLGESVYGVEGSVTGDPLSIGFNYKYVSDCFQSIASDSVSLEFAGESKPLVIRGVSDNSFLYLVSSMNK